MFIKIYCFKEKKSKHKNLKHCCINDVFREHVYFNIYSYLYFTYIVKINWKCFLPVDHNVTEFIVLPCKLSTNGTYLIFNYKHSVINFNCIKKLHGNWSIFTRVRAWPDGQMNRQMIQCHKKCSSTIKKC